MEKSSIDMELEEWELIPSNNNNHTYIDFGVESLKGVINIDYFELRDTAKEHLFEPKKQEDLRDREFKDICIVPSLLPPPSLIIDSANQVFFNKLKDDQDSPKSHIKGIIAPAMEPEPLLLEEEDEFYRDEKDSMSSEKEKEHEGCKMGKKPCWEGFGLRIWRWGAAGGVGALCSIGVAAASVCILMFGGRHTEKHEPRSQKVQFKIYADEKQIKQVMQQATRMNQALSAVRGGTVNWANISFGGYYDGL